MNNELMKELELLRFYKEKGCLDTHYKLLIDYIDELEEKINQRCSKYDRWAFEETLDKLDELERC